jgi:hypothetical protein
MSRQVLTMIHAMNPITLKTMTSMSRVLDEKAILAVMVCGSMSPPELFKAQSGQASEFAETRRKIGRKM